MAVVPLMDPRTVRPHASVGVARGVFPENSSNLYFTEGMSFFPRPEDKELDESVKSLSFV